MQLSQGSAAGGAALGQFWDSSGIGVLSCAPRTVLVPGEHPAVCLPDCSVFNNSAQTVCGLHRRGGFVEPVRK